MIKKILKRLGFEQCYLCGKWTFRPEQLRIVEDSKDSIGFLAPVCPGCYYYYTEKTFY